MNDLDYLHKIQKSRETAANKVFKAIKEILTSIKSSNKEKKYKQAVSVDVSWYDKTTSTYNKKTKCWEKGDTTYEIWVNGKQIVKDIESKNELAYIFDLIRDKLDKLKATKGWGTLVHTSETIRPMSSGGNWVIPRLSVLTKVEVPDAPCKEYKSLENYLNKYGQRKRDGYWGFTSLDLTPFKLYSVYAGGKRGVLWGEEGDRHYLANKPKKCAEILANLRKHRTSKDTMVCRFGREEYIDPIDQRYSAYHEVECDGEIREYLAITIKSDKGKVKYETTIY